MGQWKEVIRIAFKGERFKGHALDLTALDELVRFQRENGVGNRFDRASV